MKKNIKLILFILAIIIIPKNVMAYTITFDALDGTILGSQTKSYETNGEGKINVNPTSNEVTPVTGKVFYGWTSSTIDAYDNLYTSSMTAYTFTSDTTVYAYYLDDPISEVNITWSIPHVGDTISEVTSITGTGFKNSSNGWLQEETGTDIWNTPTASTYESGKTYKLGIWIYANKDEGRYFPSSTVITVNGENNTPVNFDHTGQSGSYYGFLIHYEFTPTEKFTVRFNPNGHGGLTGAECNVDGGNIIDDSLIPEMSEKGYRFDGWYTDDGTFLNEFDLESTPVTSNMNLYAKWTEIIESPQTGDNINLNIFLALISLIGLIGSIIYLNKEKHIRG